jgi:hypothetical protein
MKNINLPTTAIKNYLTIDTELHKCVALFILLHLSIQRFNNQIKYSVFDNG